MYFLCLLSDYNKNIFTNLIQFDNIKKINLDYFITNINDTNKTVKIYFFTSKYYWNIIKYNYQEYIIIDENFKFCLYDYTQNKIIQNPSVGLWHTIKQNNFHKNNCEVNLTVKCNKLEYNRISDVLIKGVQLEFQNSMIDFDKIIVRTKDYLKFAKKVIWILNYTTNGKFFMKNNLYYINKDSLINSFIGIELIDEFKDMIVLINYDDKLFYVNKEILTIIENFEKNIILCSGIKYCLEQDFYEIVKNNNDLIFTNFDSIFDKDLNKTNQSKLNGFNYTKSTIIDNNPNQCVLINKINNSFQKEKYDKTPYIKQYNNGYQKRYYKRDYEDDSDDDSVDDYVDDSVDDYVDDSDDTDDENYYNRNYNNGYRRNYNQGYNNYYNNGYQRNYNQGYNNYYNNGYRKNYYNRYNKNYY